jgi:hypothetical protein
MCGPVALSISEVTATAGSTDPEAVPAEDGAGVEVTKVVVVAKVAGIPLVRKSFQELSRARAVAVTCEAALASAKHEAEVGKEFASELSTLREAVSIAADKCRATAPVPGEGDADVENAELDEKKLAVRALLETEDGKRHQGFMTRIYQCNSALEKAEGCVNLQVGVFESHASNVARNDMNSFGYGANGTSVMEGMTPHQVHRNNR